MQRWNKLLFEQTVESQCKMYGVDSVNAQHYGGRWISVMVWLDQYSDTVDFEMMSETETPWTEANARKAVGLGRAVVRNR